MPSRETETVMEEILQDAGRLTKSIVDMCPRPVFKFMAEDHYRKVLTQDPAHAAQVYWREILYRSHLAAVTALARHSRWIEACLQQYKSEANYLGLACCLRGLLEGAADTFYSLRVVPLTIANSVDLIRLAISGQLDTGFPVVEDLEYSLIHFLYAGKPSGKGQVPPGHKAENAAAYVECMIDQNDDSVRRLYQELCRLMHPSAASVSWMLKVSADFSLIQFGGTDDDRVVRQLIDSHREAIKLVALIPLDISVCTLRVLNQLPLPEVHAPIATAYEPPAWRQVASLLQNT